MFADSISQKLRFSKVLDAVILEPKLLNFAGLILDNNEFCTGCSKRTRNAFWPVGMRREKQYLFLVKNSSLWISFSHAILFVLQPRQKGSTLLKITFPNCIGRILYCQTLE